VEGTYLSPRLFFPALLSRPLSNDRRGVLWTTSSPFFFGLLSRPSLPAAVCSPGRPDPAFLRAASKVPVDPACYRSTIWDGPCISPVFGAEPQRNLTPSTSLAATGRTPDPFYLQRFYAYIICSYSAQGSAFPFFGQPGNPDGFF